MTDEMFSVNDIQKYIDLMDNSTSKIAECVNKKFVNSKENIKEKIINKLRRILTPVPEHYVWKDNGCTYDHSGILVEDGIVSLDLTVSEFLENEYTGGSIATYESGCGLRYENYDESLSYDTLNLAGELMNNCIKDYLEKEFNEKISEEMFEFLRMYRSFDDVYDECYASDFFTSQGAVEFIGIEKMKLSEIVYTESTKTV